MLHYVVLVLLIISLVYNLYEIYTKCKVKDIKRVFFLILSTAAMLYLLIHHYL